MLLGHRLTYEKGIEDTNILYRGFRGCKRNTNGVGYNGPLQGRALLSATINCNKTKVNATLSK